MNDISSVISKQTFCGFFCVASERKTSKIKVKEIVEQYQIYLEIPEPRCEKTYCCNVLFLSTYL